APLPCHMQLPVQQSPSSVQPLPSSVHGPAGVSSLQATRIPTPTATMATTLRARAFEGAVEKSVTDRLLPPPRGRRKPLRTSRRGQSCIIRGGASVARWPRVRDGDVRPRDLPGGRDRCTRQGEALRTRVGG